MSLHDEIEMMDYMIRMQPEATIKEYLIEKELFIRLEREVFINVQLQNEKKSKIA